MADIVFTENSHLQDSVYGKVLDPLRMVIETKAEAFEQQSLLPLLFNMEKSNKYGESITGMTSMLGPQPVGEAGDYPSDGYQEGFRSFLEHVTWKDEFQISKEMLDGYAHDHFFMEGVRMYNQERYDAALDLMEHAMEYDTASAATCYSLAQYYMSMRDRALLEKYSGKAEALLQRAVRLDPDNYWYRRLLAMNYLRQNRAPEAIAAEIAAHLR